MKIRKIIAAITCTALMAAMSVTAFAGTWRTGATRTNDWWYDNGDGTWAANGWHWIDGDNDGSAECYYFDADGWMLADTVTPDGYTVNASGAWTVDGEVQKKYRVVGSNGDIGPGVQIAQITPAQNAAPAAVTAPAETAAPAEAQTAQPVQANSRDLTKAAALVGTYVGKNAMGGDVIVTLVENGDGGLKSTMKTNGNEFVDVYYYEGTFERGIVWGFENENGKDSFVAGVNQIDMGYDAPLVRQ